MFSPSINGDADSFRPVQGPVWALPLSAPAPVTEGEDFYVNSLDPLTRFAFLMGRGLSGGLLSSKASIALGYLLLGATALEVVRHIRWK